MADPPFILLLVASDEADRRLVGGLLDDGRAEVHWATAAASALAAVGEHPHDAVLLDAELGRRADDPRAAGGGPARAGDRARRPERRRRGHGGARRRRRRPPAEGGRSTPTRCERAIRYAADHRRSVERLQPRRAARRAHRAAEPHAVPRPARAVAAPRAPQRRRRRRRRAVPRPRPLQGRQRLARPPGRRPAAASRSPSGSTRRCAPATPSRGSAATSSPCCWRTSTDAREATVVAERVLATLAEPFTIAGRELFVSGSIGIALGGAGRRPGGADPRRRRRHVPRQGGRQGAPRGVRRADAPPRASPGSTSRPTCAGRSRPAALQVLYQPIVRTGDAARSPASRRSAAGRSSRASSSRSPRRPG